MSSTLVDTNVLIDVLDARSPWQAWCDRRLEEARRAGPAVVNQIIYAELSAGLPNAELVDSMLHSSRFERDDLPWNAAFLAGKAYLTYRRSGGDRRSPLPDFYIGAHATVRGYRLLTRDATRYRTYFPSLDIVSPDTHP